MNQVQPHVVLDALCVPLVQSTRAMPVDQRLVHVRAERLPQIASLCDDSAVVMPQVGPAHQCAKQPNDSRADGHEGDARNALSRRDAPSEKAAHQHDQAGDQRCGGKHPQQAEQRRGETVLVQDVGGRVVDDIADSPTVDGAGQDRSPQAGAIRQAREVVRDIDLAVAVASLSRFKFGDDIGHVAEVVVMSIDEALEFGQIAAVELDQTAAPDAFGDQPHVGRAHRQQRQQRQPGAEIHRRQAGRRIVAPVVSLEAVGLALAGPPFVLAGQFGCAHLVKQVDHVGHELSLGQVLGRAKRVAGLADLPVAAAPEMVVRLEPPDAPVDPLADLAATAQRGIDEGRVDFGHRPLGSELQPGGPTNQRLPQRPGPCGGGVGLQREGRLEADRI